MESQKLIFSGFSVLKGLMNCDDQSMKIIPELDTVLLNSIILDSTMFFEHLQQYKKRNT